MCVCSRQAAEQWWPDTSSSDDKISTETNKESYVKYILRIRIHARRFDRIADGFHWQFSGLFIKKALAGFHSVALR